MCAQSYHFLIPLNDLSFSPPHTQQQQQQQQHKPEEQNPNAYRQNGQEVPRPSPTQLNLCPICQSNMTVKLPSSATPGQLMHSHCAVCGYHASKEWFPTCVESAPSSSAALPPSFSSSLSASVLESQTHLLHGVLHANGFGHLLRINGRESGSRFLSGCQLMGLWDGLCSMLNAR